MVRNFPCLGEGPPLHNEQIEGECRWEGFPTSFNGFVHLRFVRKWRNNLTTMDLWKQEPSGRSNKV